MLKKLLLLQLGLLTTSLHGQTFSDFLILANRTAGEQKIAVIDSFMQAAGTFPFIENDTLVHFIYRGSANRVTVPGDANHWDPAAFPMSQIPGTHFWYRTESFEPDARLDYKFVLDGRNWILDPRNPHTVTGGFGPNSELRMPGYVPPPEIEFDPALPHGTLMDTTFFSSSLNNSRKIKVYLPPGYSQSQTRYPVVLFHDGLEYVSLAKANNVLDYLIAHQRIRPVIGLFVPPVQRNAEYAGSLKTRFATFITDEVFVWLDQRFRTLAEPAQRAVMGASNGGNISLYLALKRPDVFGNVAAQSSNVEDEISRGFRESPKLPLKIYLDLGTYDIPLLIPRVKNLLPILQQKGYPVIFKEFHEGHSWGNWRAHIDEALEFLFPATPSSVAHPAAVPGSVPLSYNFPNPFSPATRIAFRLAQKARVSLQVYNILGQKVANLLEQQLAPGKHEIRWNGKNQHGQELPSGIYIYVLRINERPAIRKKMILLRK